MNNTIANNKIHANFVNGIMLKDAHSLDGPSYTIIHNNTITHHRKGISMRKATHTQIIYNDIRNNIRGIKIFESSSNIISHNNFMDNIQSCFFIGGSNTWDNNYWGRPRNLPKIIFGRFGSIYELIPWFNVDWHPAQEPFEIGGIV